MNAKDVIKSGMAMASQLTGDFLKDFSDAELLARTSPNANHAAWQLGHLIESEHMMLSELGHRMPALPDGFREGHSKEAASSNDAKKFQTKDAYLALFGKIRGATLAALQSTPDADLDKPGPESMRAYAPTIGALFNLVGLHEMMHNSQFTPIRRKLGKPVLF